MTRVLPSLGRSLVRASSAHLRIVLTRLARFVGQENLPIRHLGIAEHHLEAVAKQNRSVRSPMSAAGE
eukprot:7516661-Pyramimonas_sp.AAC.1